MRTVRFKQHSAYRGPGWWHWEIWVDEPPSVLRSIKSVEYTLHRTFPKPVRMATNRSQQFRLKTAGWGVFRIFIKVFWSDGEVTEHHHDLSFALPFRPSRPRVFVSHSQADTPTAGRLKQLIADEGIELVVPGRTGSTYVTTLEHAMRRADALVIIVSGPLSPWMDEELAMAERQRLPILKVLVDTKGGPSDPLPRLKGITLHDDREDGKAVAIPSSFLRALKVTLGDLS